MEANIEIALYSQTTSEQIDAPHFPAQGQPSSQHEVDVKGYIDLHRAATEGDWNAAKKIIESNPDALKATISLQGMTALHVAARNGRSEFVERLVERLPANALANSDKYDRNALHYIATVGTVSAAQKLVKANPNLPQEMDENGYTPIFSAVLLGLPQRRREMVKFLAEVTKDEAPSRPFTGEFSTHLILGIVDSGYYGN